MARSFTSARVGFDPPLKDWPDAGVYQLWIRLPRNARITIGRLGRFLFPAGTYVYTGRASRALPARVSRHVSGARKVHWHIDYLLAHQQTRIVRVALASFDPEAECELNQAIAAQARCVAGGFGSSDCRAGCGSHLWLVDGFEGSP